MAGTAYQPPAIPSGVKGYDVGNGTTQLYGGKQVPTSAYQSFASGNSPGNPYNIPSIYAGMPAGPGYTDALSGVNKLGPEAQSVLGGVNLDTTGLDKFKSEAFRQGPSQWAKDAVEQQNYLAMQAKDQGAATAAGAAATGRASLAARGGLSGGAAERLAQGGANNYLDMTQGINDTANKNTLQIGMNDEQNRLSELGQVPGMDLAKSSFDMNKATTQLGADQTDNTNQMNANMALNQWNLGAYGQATSGWAAQQNADANRHTGKSL